MVLLSELEIEKETDNSITISKKSWHEILSVISKAKKNTSRQDLAQYAGSIKLNKNPLEFQKEIRNEWQ